MNRTLSQSFHLNIGYYFPTATPVQVVAHSSQMIYTRMIGDAPEGEAEAEGGVVVEKKGKGKKEKADAKALAKAEAAAAEV